MNPLAQTPPEQPGTAEDDWRRWGTRFPDLDLRACRRLVVVAPHPDDETVGLGGLMAICARRGTPVVLVAVTDGEASHPERPPQALARTRIAETRRALTQLSVEAVPVRLRLPDGRVAAHESTLGAALTDLLCAQTWCAATWRGDGHPDHDAVGQAAAAACAATGSRLLEYPVWMWHWAMPGEPSVPWPRARSISLPTVIHRAKLAAVGQFRSQTEPPAPVLPGHVLAHWLRPHETVFV